MKKLSLAPYHLFQFRGSNYVFDIESSAVMRLDDPAYNALSLRLENAPSDAIASRLTAVYGEETPKTALPRLCPPWAAWLLHWELRLRGHGAVYGPLSRTSQMPSKCRLDSLQAAASREPPGNVRWLACTAVGERDKR